MLSLCTSELSCFPKYMSEEMAFTSPNFVRASPVSETGTGSGFRLAVGLSFNDDIVELMKKSSSGFLLSFIQPPPSSHPEEKLSEVSV